MASLVSSDISCQQVSLHVDLAIYFALQACSRIELRPRNAESTSGSKPLDGRDLSSREDMQPENNLAASSAIHQNGGICIYDNDNK